MSTTLTEEDDFSLVYQEIRCVMAQVVETESGIRDAYDWLDKVLEYNMNQCKNTSGRLLVTSFKTLTKCQPADALKIARVLGWCVEMLQANFEMSLDFITQRSVNIHGKQCWHTVNDIGVLSINDSVFTKSGMYYIIKKFTRDKPYYKDVMELFLETVLHRIIGQRLELRYCSGGNVDLNEYTMSRYTNLTGYKGAFNKLHLPVACAMYMASITDEAAHSAAKDILLELGQLAQIQEDFNNCFGKVVPPAGFGSYIKDRKCTWLIARALELASDTQKTMLQTYFHQENDLDVTQILDIYKSLGLETEYRHLLNTRLRKIVQLIHSSQRGDSQSLFLKICGDVFPMAYNNLETSVDILNYEEI